MTRYLNKKKIKRGIQYFIICLLFILLITSAGIFWVVGSQSGTQWLMSQVLDSVPELTVQKFQGRLINSVTLSHIRYRNKDLDISVESAKIKWQPRQLLSKLLTIDSLQLSGIFIKVLAVSENPSHSTQPTQSLREALNGLRIPIDVDIRQFELLDASFQSYGAEKAIAVQRFLIRASLIDQRITIKTLGLQSDIVDVQGDLMINDIYDQINQNQLLDEKIKGNFQWVFRSSDLADLKGKTVINGHINNVRLNTTLASPYSSSIDLSVIDLLDKIQLSLSVNSEAINLSAIHPQWPSYQLQGDVQFKGGLDDYSVHSTVSFVDKKPESKPIKGDVSISAIGTDKKITFPHITLNGDAGHLMGKGELVIKPQLKATLDLSGDDINPGVFSREWPGKLTVNAQVNSETLDLTNTHINAEIKISGMLRQYPVLLDTKAKYKDNSFYLNKLRYESGKSRIDLSSILKNGQTLSATWSVNSHNLQELIPSAKGRIHTKGKIDHLLISTGIPRPKIIADIQASSISTHDINVKKINGLIDIDWANPKKNQSDRINISVQGVSQGNIDIDNILLKTTGNLEKHSMNINVTSHHGNADVSLSGQLLQQTTQPEWKFKLDSALLTPPNELAPWQLDTPLLGSVSADKQLIAHHCWTSGSGSLCFEVDRQGLNNNSRQKVRSVFTLSELPVSYFAPLLPDDVLWQGSTINGDGQLELSSADDINATIDINSSQGQLIWRQNKGKEIAPNKNPHQVVILQAGKLLFKSTKEKANISLHLPIDNDKGLEGSVAIFNQSPSFIERPVKGKLALQINDLSLLEPFIVDASDIKGKLFGQWDLDGSIENPRIDGKLSLSDAQLQLDTPNIFLKNIQLNLVGNQQKNMTYQVSADSGKGSIYVDGAIHNLLHKAPQFIVNIKGENFQALNTDEANVLISPDIKLMSRHDEINITGDVLIPKAVITPKRIPASTVKVSEDEVIIDQSVETKTAALQQKIMASLNIILGDEVSIDGFGFKGRATGKVRVTKSPEDLVLANGKIQVLDGEYRAFGQGLVIDKGVILFSDGPVAKPGIDIKALRRPAEDITVGVFARGSLAQPELTLFSEPAMSQSEQLSWLVLGRPLENSSEGENNAINQLLLSLSLGKTDSILNRVGETFNLDTVGINTGSGEAGAESNNDLAELVLGKYLSPSLYVSYGIGLFNPVNVLSLEYRLGRSWTLKTETSSEGSGGDLVYSIER